ncbi:MAG: DEAD/DEAH box helicase [Bacillota bacterium]|nr:DEAD/DEAH box helicase [Bacillota bacterium]
MASTFEELGLKPELVSAVADMGFERPTPIQEKAIPLALTGRDVLGQAQTGTGKTAAFGLPILNGIVPGGGLQVLILCPTRELAVQVAMDLTNFGRHLKTRALPVYGGQSIDHQVRALRAQPEVVVGTPGRVLDHLRRGTLSLDTVRFAVLDEADEMLDMGFREDIEDILARCPAQRQTMLFSATMAPPIAELARSFLHEPAEAAIRGLEITAPLIEQRYYEVNPKQKVETLCRILDIENPASAMIFCRTKRGADDLVENLRVRGYAAEVIHGDLSQRERDSVMARFRAGSVELLVASDVAARGLDISHVTHVINFDIPQDPDSYVNRIGRTGRAGREGVAITLVTPREVRQLRFIERTIGKRIRRRALPTLAEAIERRQQLLASRVTAALEEPAGEYRSLAGQLLEEYDSTDLVATLLRLLDSQGRELERAELEDARPELTSVRVPLGRADGLRVGDLIQQLVGAGIARREIGNIKILDEYSYVQVPAECADQIYNLFKGGRGRRRSRYEGPPPRRRPGRGY